MLKVVPKIKTIFLKVECLEAFYNTLTQRPLEKIIKRAKKNVQNASF